MKSKILVVGSTGQVGHSFKDLFESLANPNYEVWYTDRRDTSKSNDQILVCDLTSEKSLRAVMQEVQPNLLLNCAAYTAVDKAETERDVALAINGAAPGVLADECRKYDALMVHYSTDYVFNGTGHSPWKEDSPTNPVNYYGETKLAGEQAVRKSGCRHLILRTQWVYSSHGHNFVKTMLRLGKERETLNIVGDQVGAPTSSDVIARTTMDLISALGFKTKAREVYNLACRGEVSWHGFAQQIFAEAQKHNFPLKVTKVGEITSADFPTPAKRPQNSRLSLQKMESTLGHPMPSWQDALVPVIETLRLSKDNQP